MKKFLAIIVLLIVSMFTGTVQANEVHGIGVNVVDSKGVVYRIEGGSSASATKTPYTSAGAFTSYKFNTWSIVQKATALDIALKQTLHSDGGLKYVIPRAGALINDKGTVYQIVSGNTRAGFASESVFKGLGYAYSNVYPGDTSFMVADTPISTQEKMHPPGTLINDNGTLYIMLKRSKVGIPSMAILDSWGYWVTDAVTANSFDKAAQKSGDMELRTPSFLTVFDTELYFTEPDEEPAKDKVYTNTSYNFQIQYPTDWTTDESNYLSFMSIATKNARDLNTTYCNDGDDATPCNSEFYPASVNFTAEISDKDSSTLVGTKTFNGIIFNKYVDGGLFGAYTAYVTSRGGINYIFTANAQEVPMMEQLLASFKFIY